MSILIAVLALCCQQSEKLDFPEMIRMAGKYELPAPPQEAPLVLAFAECTQLVGSSSTSDDPGVYQPAFLLEKLPEDRARVLVGWEEKTVEPWADHIPATRPYSPVPPERKLKGYVLDCANLSGFATAVQLARRGQAGDAQTLWEQVRRQPFFDIGSPHEDVRTLLDNPRLLMARMLYQYLHDDTLREGADLKGIHARLVQLKEEFPDLFSDDEASFYPHRRTCFIRDLERMVSAAKPAEGSVEALLVEYGNLVPVMYGGQRYFHERVADSARPACDIFRLGLKALPELARLTEDRRLTRHVRHAIMNAPEERIRLGGLAAVLLADMIGSCGPEGAAALKEHPEPENIFFARAAVELKDGVVSAFHEVPLWILGEKHPEVLADLCKDVPAKAAKEAQLFLLTDAVLRSRLAPEEKSSLLAGMAERLADDPRLRSALQPLAEIDAPKCAALLKPVLARVPKDVDGEYWTSETAHWTHVVMRLEDDEIWKLYLKAARNAAVGLRMEMMNPMNYSYIGEKNRQRRLAFLSAFLDDTTARDPSVDAKKYDGSCAAFTFEKIEVRDFVAMEIASILDMPDRPTEFWMGEQWAELRGKVREALKKEKLPALSD